MTTTAQRSTGTGVGLSCRDVSMTLGGRTVLDGVSLTAAPGSWVSVIGPNGAGKTTLVRCLAGLLSHDGEVLVGERPLGSLARRERARTLAVVPQHATVPPGMSVVDYVLLGRAPHQGLRLTATDDDVGAVHAVLQRIDLEHLAERALDTLSGGERQRVVIARALAQEARVLVLDEPSTALDLGHQIEVLELVDDLRRERGLTVVSTLHDLGLAGQFSERIALLVDGGIVAEGAPAEVLTSELIGRHYGAEVRVEHDDDGAVSVIVRRRRERP